MPSAEEAVEVNTTRSPDTREAWAWAPLGEQSAPLAAEVPSSIRLIAEKTSPECWLIWLCFTTVLPARCLLLALTSRLRAI